ncbi:hypothetical protein FACS1894151_05460 [Spirochaetia bacterium]|nr:hypothetical protein FACS1894151_05460 [Spirochaetia bacterium]
MKTAIACIGSGNMGTALMKGAAGIAGSGNIGFADADKAKAKAAAKIIGGFVYSSNSEAVKKGDLIFLAVKPQVLEAVLEEIAPALQKRLLACMNIGKAQTTETEPTEARPALSDNTGTDLELNYSVETPAGLLAVATEILENPPVLVSMAAGWSIERIQGVFSRLWEHKAHRGRRGGRQSKPEMPELLPPVIRIMPNTPALIGEGMIAYTFSPEVPNNRAAQAEQIFSAAGKIDRVDEHLLDAVTALSGSAPAFVYMFIEALADGGVRAGLPRDKALAYAAQTVLGAAAMVRDTGRHPGELKDMVTSPAGTTIAGVNALENGAFRGTVMNAVEAAYRRAVDL